MKLVLLSLAASAAIAMGAGTASAQPVVVPGPVPYAGPTYVAPAYPAYSPGVVVTTPGLSIGVGGPIGVGVGVVPGYRYPYGYPGYYYGYRGYGPPVYRYHHGRW